MRSVASSLVTAASPVVQAGLLAAVGAAMARHGTLDCHGTSVVAALCFHVFTPALTFSTLAASISIDSIRHFWPLLANMVISIVCGVGAGYACAAAVRTPRDFRNIVVAAVSFGNIGSLPLVFVGALCGDRSAAFYRALGARCETLGIAYTAFDICAATLLQFSVALQLLRPPSTALAAPGVLPPAERRAASLECIVQGGCVAAGSGSGIKGSQRQPEAQPAAGNVAMEMQPRARHAHPQHVGPRPPDPEDRDDSLLLPTSDHGHPVSNGTNGSAPARHGHGHGASRAAARLPRATAWLEAGWQWARDVDWMSAFPLPTQAAIAGLVVGCVPWLRGLLYSPPGVEGGGPPLRVVAQAVDLLGAGLIPGAIPLLGAVLWRGPGDSRLPWQTTAGVVATRLVIVPLVLTAAVAAALRLRLFTPPDPMFMLTMLLANATPSAINLQTMAVLYKHGAAEMAVLLFWQYLASLLTLPAFTWLFLHVVQAFLPA